MANEVEVLLLKAVGFVCTMATVANAYSGNANNTNPDERADAAQLQLQLQIEIALGMVGILAVGFCWYKCCRSNKQDNLDLLVPGFSNIQGTGEGTTLLPDQQKPGTWGSWLSGFCKRKPEDLGQPISNDYPQLPTPA